MKWYLAGPIAGITNGEDYQWRKDIKSYVYRNDPSSWIKFIDPFEREDTDVPQLPGSEEGKGWKPIVKAARDKNDTALLKVIANHIITLDTQSVLMSDGVIANLTYCSDCPPIGTICEIFMAYQQGKPIIIICDEKLPQINLWIWGLATKIVRNEIEAIDWIYCDHKAG